MRYYTIQNGSLLIADSFNALSKYYSGVQPLPEDYEDEKYIVVEHKEEIEVTDFDPETGELIGTHTEVKITYTLELNPNFEEEQKQKEYERIQALSMTRSDFFDGTIQAWGVGQDELLVLVQSILTTIPIDNTKELMAINNFRNALNFYRKHDLFKMIVNIPIQLSETVQVLILDEHLDKFFDEVNKGNKETAWQYLPQPVATPIETNEESSEVDGEVVDVE